MVVYEVMLHGDVGIRCLTWRWVLVKGRDKELVFVHIVCLLDSRRFELTLLVLDLFSPHSCLNRRLCLIGLFLLFLFFLFHIHPTLESLPTIFSPIFFLFSRLLDPLGRKHDFLHSHLPNNRIQAASIQPSVKDTSFVPYTLAAHVQKLENLISSRHQFCASVYRETTGSTDRSNTSG